MPAFFKAFVYAWSGICHALKTQRNMKVHALMSIFAVLLSWVLNLNSLEWGLLCLTLGMVICAEMLNSALEYTLDLISLEQQPQIKHAKDMAAGAVLIVSIIAAIMGLILWGNKIYLLISRLVN